MIRDLQANKKLGLHPVGVLADDLAEGQRLLGIRVVGSVADLAAAVKRHHAAAVLLAMPSADGPTLRRLVRQAESAGARCLTVPSVAEALAGRIKNSLGLMQVFIDEFVAKMAEFYRPAVDTEPPAGSGH